MISVCMALYNGERFVRNQTLSILSQLGQNDEIVISDDSSRDSSLTILRDIGDPRIHILENRERLGPAMNLQRALSASKGSLIFLSDHDDLWMPEKLARCIAALETCDLVLHDAVILNAEGIQVQPSLFQIRGVKRGFWANWFRNSYTGCCMAFRRSVLQASLPFPPEIPMHDQWIGLIAERNFKVSFLPETLIGYRQHGGNATNTVHGSNNSIWTRLHWRISLLRALFMRP